MTFAQDIVKRGGPWDRAEIIGDALLLQGDCLLCLPTLAKVDAVITDPQYGLGFDYGHDDSPAYVTDVCVPAISMARDTARRVIAFPGVHNVWKYPPADWLLSWSWRSTSHFGKCGYSMWQPALFYGADLPQFGNANGVTKTDSVHFPDGNGIGFLSDGPREDHPCPKPDKLMRWLVARFSNPTETVLDPFMGSGTTGVAAVQLGRKFIGCEIEPKYYAIACERIENAQRQLSLLDPYEAVTRSYEQAALL